MKIVDISKKAHCTIAQGIANESAERILTDRFVFQARVSCEQA